MVYSKIPVFLIQYFNKPNIINIYYLKIMKIKIF